MSKNIHFLGSLKSRITSKRQDASNWLAAQGNLFSPLPSFGQEPVKAAKNWIKPANPDGPNPLEFGAKSRPDSSRFSADAKNLVEKNLVEKSLIEKRAAEKRTRQDEEEWISDKKQREDDLRNSSLKYFQDKLLTPCKTPSK